MEFTQHFHDALTFSGPDQNMVQLPPGGWDGLPEQMEDLLKDDQLAQRIADNAVRTLRSRYLTPAATTCYWRRALAEYASIQQFIPTIGKGVDYESFAMVEQGESRAWGEREVMGQADTRLAWFGRQFRGRPTDGAPQQCETEEDMT